MAMNKHLSAFHDWRVKVRHLLRRRGLRPQDVVFGDWRFDWYESFAAGCRPYEAIEDAIAELRGRGLLDENGDKTEEYADSLKRQR